MSTPGSYDYLLMAVVTVQALVLAYLYEPRWKALILSLPIPFTCAALALAQPIDASNVMGMVLLFGYVHGVRILHLRFGVPIIVAIVAVLAGYAVLAVGMAAILPHSNEGFWWACLAALTLAGLSWWQHPHRDEPGHRTSLPIWAKLPVVVLVVLVLILVKKHLRGFMTTFPMVGVLAAYEARHSLWTLCGAVPMMTLAIIPLMAVCRLSQEKVGLPMALVFGWVVYLCILIPLSTRSLPGSKPEPGTVDNRSRPG